MRASFAKIAPHVYTNHDNAARGRARLRHWRLWPESRNAFAASCTLQRKLCVHAWANGLPSTESQRSSPALSSWRAFRLVHPHAALGPKLRPAEGLTALCPTEGHTLPLPVHWYTPRCQGFRRSHHEAESNPLCTAEGPSLPRLAQGIFQPPRVAVDPRWHRQLLPALWRLSLQIERECGKNVGTRHHCYRAGGTTSARGSLKRWAERSLTRRLRCAMRVVRPMRTSGGHAVT